MNDKKRLKTIDDKAKELSKLVYENRDLFIGKGKRIVATSRPLSKEYNIYAKVTFEVFEYEPVT